jgi:hypothetical protein
LNIGDFLLGEGYRLLATVDAPAEIRSAMSRAAAEGHRTLCLGQGAELLWARDPQPMKADHVLGIFSQKTTPAFEVALQLGTCFPGRISMFPQRSRNIAGLWGSRIRSATIWKTWLRRILRPCAGASEPVSIAENAVAALLAKRSPSGAWEGRLSNPA